MTFAERRSEILERLTRACRDADRDPASVQLLAASKTRTPDDVREAIAAGHLPQHQARTPEATLTDEEEDEGSGR